MRAIASSGRALATSAPTMAFTAKGWERQSERPKVDDAETRELEVLIGPCAIRDDRRDPRIVGGREDRHAGAKRDPEHRDMVRAERLARGLYGRDDVARLRCSEADRATATPPSATQIEEQRVVAAVMEEPRPRQHLGARCLETVDEDDGRRADSREREPSADRRAVGGRERDVRDSEVGRRAWVGVFRRDERVGTNDRQEHPREDGKNSEDGEDTPYRLDFAHSAARAARRSMIPRWSARTSGRSAGSKARSSMSSLESRSMPPMGR